MAFNRDFLGRVSSTANSNVPTTWTYTSADPMGLISYSNYFHLAKSLRVNDILNIKGGDGHTFYIVTQIDIPVTIVRYKEILNLFGDWDSRSVDTTYTENVDGFVHGTIESPQSAEGRLEAETPVGSKKGVCKTNVLEEYNLWIASVTIPVRKGDSWKMVKSDINGTSTYQIYFIPFALARITS